MAGVGGGRPVRALLGYTHVSVLLPIPAVGIATINILPHQALAMPHYF